MFEKKQTDKKQNQTNYEDNPNASQREREGERER